MTGRRVLGIIFIVVGALGLAVGLYTALSALGGLYNDTLDNPLEESRGGDAKQISKTMLQAVVTGVIGAIPFTIGLRLALPRRARGSRRHRLSDSELP